MSGKRKGGKDNYGYSNVVRNEVRHTHDGPEEAPHRKRGGKKNKPCKKSPDKLHSYVHVPYILTFSSGKTVDWGDTKCEFCGKRR